VDRVLLILTVAAGVACAHPAVVSSTTVRAPPAVVESEPGASATGHPSPVVEIALAYERSCARLANGTVQCWGLGYDDAAHPSPVQVAGISDAAGLAIGPTHACAKTRAGRVRCWGSNEHGALGDGTREGTFLSATDPGLESVLDVGVGAGFTCATTNKGTSCWGDNKRGTLGLGMIHDGELRPTLAPLLSHVQSLAISGKHAFALSRDASVIGWGDGCALFGGGPAPKPTPMALTFLGRVREIASSSTHACALIEGGTVVCFGNNDDGQLGDGTTDARDGLVVAHGVYDAVQIAVADRSSCARLSSGHVSCWGANDFGQLGDGSTIGHAKPARIPGLAGVARIAVGGSHACALMDDGSTQCWGSNRSGELGDRTRASRSVRAPVIF
jgi:alpha-tubulin suppressor-like RCC1 family protein